jgi:hypothetical protein
LYVKDAYANLIFPVTISEEGIGNTQLQMEFSWTGTQDFAPYLSIPAAFDFREKLGESAIMNYMHSLAVQSGQVLSSAWGTETLVDDSMIGAMVNVRLPLVNQVTFNASQFEMSMLTQFNTWVPAFPVATINGPK